MKPTRRFIPAGLALAAPPVSDARETVVVDYLRGMRELVETQRQVMLQYLGDTAPIVARPAIAEVVAVLPVLVTGAPVQTQSVTETLLAIVSERTGYPIEMLGLDLDLEADLSIDSIKRIESLGALSERTGMGGDGDRDGFQAARIHV